MGETGYFITAIVSLATAVVTLWVHNAKREKKFNEQNNENLINMTRALNDSTHAIENNTKSHDRIYEYILNGKKK